MKKNCVMIIDDDDYTIELYKMLMEWSENKEYVKTELSAAKAMNDLKALNEKNPEKFPDYVLLDLRMPEMHGFDFIRKFEKNFPERKNKTGVIITTSSIINKEKEEAFRFSSVKKYIVKPIPADYIEKLVTEGMELTEAQKNNSSKM